MAFFTTKSWHLFRTLLSNFDVFQGLLLRFGKCLFVVGCQKWRFGAILALSDLGVAPKNYEMAPGALRHWWRLWKNGLKLLILLRNSEIFEKNCKIFSIFCSKKSKNGIKMGCFWVALWISNLAPSHFKLARAKMPTGALRKKFSGSTVHIQKPIPSKSAFIINILCSFKTCNMIFVSFLHRKLKRVKQFQSKVMSWIFFKSIYKLTWAY